MWEKEDSYLQLETIRAGVDGAAEMDRHRPLVFVPRGEIERLEVAFRPGAERPAVTLVIGGILVALSLLPLVMLVNALTLHVPFPDKAITAVAFIIPGMWLLDLSLRRRWVLLVHRRNGGARKLLFPRGIDGVEVERFLSNVRERFGYM